MPLWKNRKQTANSWELARVRLLAIEVGKAGLGGLESRKFRLELGIDLGSLL